jgi:hypothetical protein
VPFIPSFNALIRLGDNDNDPSGATEFKVGTTNSGQMSWGVVNGNVQSGWVPVRLTMSAGGGPGAVVLTVNGTSITYNDALYNEILQLDVQVLAASDWTCTIAWQHLRVNGVDLTGCNPAASSGRTLEGDTKGKEGIEYIYGAGVITLPSGTTELMFYGELQITVEVPDPQNPPPFNTVRAYIWVNSEQ